MIHYSPPRTAGSSRLIFSSFVLIASSTLGSLSIAAEIGLCLGETENTAAVFEKNLYSENGESLKILVSHSPLPKTTCQTQEIILDTEKLLWADVMPKVKDGMAIPLLTLQGTFNDAQATVSEIIFSRPSNAVESLSIIGRNILSDMDPIRFGPSDKSSWQSPNTLECESGDTIAGAQLRSPATWPNEIPLQLRILATGNGSFQLALADNARIESESPMNLGSLNLSSPTLSSYEYSLPDNPEPWRAITLVCTELPSRIEIEGIYLIPDIAAHLRDRSAWIWSPDYWLNKQKSIWSLVEAESLDILYITVPVNQVGQVVADRQLDQFIREATTRGIDIWAVIGDPRDVLQPNLPTLLSRINAYANYNANRTVSSQLAGVQLDIEPYLLPGFTLGSDYWRMEYLRTVAAARSQLPESMNLDLVMPVWWGSHPAWGGQLFAGLESLNVSLTIMNYRTDHEALRSGALPFLQWGLLSDHAIRIALESGSLANEQRRSYSASNGEAELWLFEYEQAIVLALFDSRTLQTNGAPYTFANESEFSSSNLTFSGDTNQLNRSALVLGREWNDWPSFSGIAIHGLDEIYLRDSSDEQKQ